MALLGKSTTKSKNAILPTRELWKGIHFTKDVKPAPRNDKEHFLRVFNREETPFVTDKGAFLARFAPVKDRFVEKYEPLLKENERLSHLESLAERSRDYLLKQRESQEKPKPTPRIPGLPPHLPLKPNNNIWADMEKLVMRDGRVYSLESVL